MAAKAQRRAARLRVVWILLLFCQHSIFAQRLLQWRTFKIGESPAVAISSSPRGSVWVKHAESPELTWISGYSMVTIQAPETNSFRPHEGRSGQVWLLAQDGLLVYENGRWRRFQINEIQSEMERNRLRQLRQIPILPADANRVFFLLTNALMEFDAVQLKVSIIRTAEKTSIGPFMEMLEAHDGGVWVSGWHGAAYIPGPLRRLTPATPWREFPASESLGVEKFQRPFEDFNGRPLMSVEQRLDNVPKAIVRLLGEKWVTIPVRGEKVRQAWGGWDDNLWGLTHNSLVRIEPGSDRPPVQEGAPGIQYDVARETNGVFWIATSEGAVRYAPTLWQTPPAFRNFSIPFHAILPGSSNQPAWFACSEGLVAYTDKPGPLIRWPEEVQPLFHPSHPTDAALYRMPDGRILVSSSSLPLLFDPASNDFVPLQHPKNRNIKVIGQFKDGSLCIRSAETDKASQFRLETYQEGSFTRFRDPPPGGWGLGPDLFTMLLTQDGDLWLGGMGLGRFPAGKTNFEVFGAGQGFTSDRANSLLELPDGRIWCGGSDKLLEFSGGRWHVLRTGLDRVHHISRDRQGGMWISTSAGIHRFVNGAWVQNEQDEGIPNVTVFNVVEDRGAIWAATLRGISLYHPEADPDPPHTQEPALENAGPVRAEETTVVTLKAVDKWDYCPQSSLLFSTRLDEGAWSPYTNVALRTLPVLPAGKHRLEVRSLDRNGNEDTQGNSLEFAVVTPWFRDPRLLAVSICGLVVIIVLAGLAVNGHIRLRRSYAEVEKIVAERTLQLEEANQQLLQSAKMRALGTLASGIAHDFNNILSVIKGSAQIIEKNLEDREKIQTRVSRIKVVAEQGAAIVRSILGLGRWTEKDLVQCDLREVVSETIKTLSDRFPMEVLFKHDRSTVPLYGYCSKEALQQILMNLLLNAADAIAGKGEISLRTSFTTAPASRLALAPQASTGYGVISVSDSGHGIAPEIMPRIFEPFFTTKAFSSRRGTGLGLSMVYELAKGMGYGLEVDSPPGQGATFTIYVPLLRSPVQPNFV